MNEWVCDCRGRGEPKIPYKKMRPLYKRTKFLRATSSHGGSYQRLYNIFQDLVSPMGDSHSSASLAFLDRPASSCTLFQSERQREKEIWRTTDWERESANMGGRRVSCRYFFETCWKILLNIVADWCTEKRVTASFLCCNQSFLTKWMNEWVCDCRGRGEPKIPYKKMRPLYKRTKVLRALSSHGGSYQRLYDIWSITCGR